MKDYIINEQLLAIVIQAVGELKAGMSINGALVSGIHTALMSLKEKDSISAEE